MPHCMSMEERAAAAVLAGEPDLEALHQERCVGERLRETPVDRQLAGGHLLAILHDACNLTMQRDVGRWRRELRSELAQLFDTHSGRHGSVPVGLRVLAPVDRVLVADQAE